MDLNTIWFLLFGVLITGYAILDGFDLGVGVLHLFARSEEERRIHINAIGPVWDGNEVWLLTGGGALFAAFPVVYATVFSGFYLALVLVLVALILRAISFEFRGKVASPAWRAVWDAAFGVGSLVPALIFGVAVGNILRGLPFDAQGDVAVTLFGLLNPYALLIGVLGLAMFVVHGATYLTLKTEGPLQARIVDWAPRLWVAYVLLFCIASVATVGAARYLFQGGGPSLFTWLFGALFVAAALGYPFAMKARRVGLAFTASSVAIAAQIGLAAAGLFPRLVPSRPDLAQSLTIYNAASSPRTQTVMLVIALVGMPCVIGYTVWIYRVFRGKTALTATSY
jgi:cytochrome bd ubiquinol oxidase subunit II